MYAIQYAYESKWAKLTKTRSYFYRPEEIVNREMWEEVRKGNEVLLEEDAPTK
jgi:hypothetical protein